MKNILSRLTTVAVVLLAFILGWFAWSITPVRPGPGMRECVPMW